MQRVGGRERILDPPIARSRAVDEPLHEMDKSLLDKDSYFTHTAHGSALARLFCLSRPHFPSTSLAFAFSLSRSDVHSRRVSLTGAHTRAHARTCSRCEHLLSPSLTRTHTYTTTVSIADTTLVFESRFESGNLYRATQVAPYEYGRHFSKVSSRLDLLCQLRRKADF